MSNMANFKKAFALNRASSTEVCVCGRMFFNDNEGTWGFTEFERDKLRNEPNAIALNYAVTCIRFEGREYVMDCNCWQERAKMIAGFLDSHAYSIAEYLSLEKERKQKEADVSPLVR